MPRNKRCCCRIAGIQRLNVSGGGSFQGGGGGLFINPADDLQLEGGGLCLKRWPCWADPYEAPGVLTYDGCFEAGGVRTVPDAGAAILGFNNAQNSILFGTLLSSFAVNRLGLAPGESDAPAIINARNNNCEIISSGTNIFATGGYLPWDTLIDVGDCFALQSGSIPGGTVLSGTAPTYSGWIGCTNERIFAATEYFTDGFVGQGHFLVWSVKYDGSDYTVLYNMARASLGDTPLPKTANIANGIAYHVSITDAGAELFENGGSLGVMTHAGDGAAARMLGQVLLLTPGKLIIFSGGASGDDLAVQFVALNDADEEMSLTPISIAYDKTHEAVVVFWYGGPGLGFGYVTYIKAELSPGNIIGQGGVDIYGVFPSASCGEIGQVAGGGGGFGGAFDIGAATAQAAVVIEGRLPRPCKVTAGHIEPPLPPALPVDCSTFIDCDGEMDMFAAFFPLLTAHTQSLGTFDSIDFTALTTVSHNWQDVPRVNVSLVDVQTRPIPGGRPASGLSDSSYPGMRMFWGPIGTFGSYSDPGILEFDTTYDDPSYHYEKYLCGVIVVVDCTDGKGTVAHVLYEEQDFKGHPGGTVGHPGLGDGWDWPPTSGPHNVELHEPMVLEDVSKIELYGVPGNCAMSGMRAVWNYDELDDSSPTDGSNAMCVYAQVGPAE